MTEAFLIARLKIRSGGLPDFSRVMGPIVGVMESHGWKLLGSYSSIIGDLHEVTDLWEVPDANSVGAVRLAARDHPDYKEYGPELKGLIESEVTTLSEKTPFSP